MALIRLCSVPQALDSTRDVTDIRRPMDEVPLAVGLPRGIKFDAV